MFGIYELSEEIKNRITGKTFPADTKDIRITYGDLRYLTVDYVNFDGEICQGEIICNQKIAEDLLEIFRILFINQYPIEKIRLIDEYDADDERSMSDNNSSAFNYRVIAGTDRLSNHALGMAIDINPLYNPYLPNNPATTPIQPANGAPYIDRSRDFPHKIDHEDLCYRTFRQFGFRWGGDWTKSKDYQHFEK